MNSINIEPLNDKIIVKSDPKREKTDTGIIIPENAKEHYVDLKWGTVVRVSAKVTSIKEGERVQFPAGAGKEEPINGTNYLYLNAGDAWAIERPEDPKRKL